MSYSDLARVPGVISFAEVRRHLDSAGLEDRCAILEFIQKNAKRIHPHPEDEWMCDQLAACYLDCIAHKHPENEYRVLTECEDRLPTPFEAANAMVGLFAWLLYQQPDGGQRAASVASRLTQLYRAVTADVQNVIETGFLEHVLEFPEARPLFKFWSDDPVLHESYQAALSWGLAHTRTERA